MSIHSDASRRRKLVRFDLPALAGLRRLIGSAAVVLFQLNVPVYARRLAMPSTVPRIHVPRFGAGVQSAFRRDAISCALNPSIIHLKIDCTTFECSACGERVPSAFAL